MLRIIFAYNKKDPMTRIVESRIKEDLLKGHIYSSVDLDKFNYAVESLGLSYNQTLIIKNHETGVELSRLEGPFETHQVKSVIDQAVQFLQSRKGGSL